MIDWRSYDATAETYERVQAAHMKAPAADLVALAALAPGAKLLDVGTGTGVVLEAARSAVGPAGAAIGIDPSRRMLQVGAERRPGDRVVGDVLDLPFDDGVFDTVTAGFSIMFFRKYDTAMFDMMRVLRLGGTMAVSVWANRRDAFLETWYELCEQAVGKDLLADALKQARPWEKRFEDPDALKATLEEVGLRKVRVEDHEYRFDYRLPDYVASREHSVTGQFVRSMLGESGFERFRDRARAVYAERFPDPLTDFQDALLAVGVKE